jgi:hypothetical protein
VGSGRGRRVASRTRGRPSPRLAPLATPLPRAGEGHVPFWEMTSWSLMEAGVAIRLPWGHVPFEGDGPLASPPSRTGAGGRFVPPHRSSLIAQSSPVPADSRLPAPDCR